MRKTRILGIVIAIVFVLSLFQSAADQYDIIIHKVKIVDGSGNPAFNGSIGIKGDKIIVVGKVKGEAIITIDGSGLVACPGFIDPHSHGDFTILDYPLAENLIMQGITTFIGGNCGHSPAPAPNLSLADWLTKVEKKGISPNMALMVGHSTVRGAVMGKDWRRTATKEEIEQMKSYTEEAMRDGAFGLSSSGRDYDPTRFADIHEFIELAKISGQYRGQYAPHTEHSSSQWFTDDPAEVSYGLYYGRPEDILVGRYSGHMDALKTSRESGTPLHIGHFFPCYKIHQPHPDYLDAAVAKATLEEVIDKGNDEGINVTFDIIPSASTINGQTPIINEFFKPQGLPIIHSLQWLKHIDQEEFIEKLKTEKFRSKLRQIHDSCQLKLSVIHTKEDPFWMDCFKIVSCKNKEYEGKTVGEIAALRNTDPLETVFDLMVEDPQVTWVVFRDKRYEPAAIPVLLKHPGAMPCTDIYALPASLADDEKLNEAAARGLTPNPAYYGMYPQYIARYVRETKALSLEDAVRKATSFPAEVFGIKDRGRLRAGAYADVVLFNLETINMTGDFKHPDQPPEGIEYVLVNGKIVYKAKKHTGLKPGNVLRHTH